MRPKALAAGLIAALALLAACSNGAGVSAEGEATGAATAPPLAGGAAGSCVEQYSLQALRDRDLAFDGTVEAVTPGGEGGETPAQVRFRVNEWYEGGSGDEVSLKSYSAGAVTSAGGPALTPGARLLVAGDGGFVWECGFTQPYSAAVAAEWKSTFAG